MAFFTFNGAVNNNLNYNFCHYGCEFEKKIDTILEFLVVPIVLLVLNLLEHNFRELTEELLFSVLSVFMC